MFKIIKIKVIISLWIGKVLSILAHYNRFFITIDLLKELQTLEFNVTGTISKNRIPFYSQEADEIEKIPDSEIYFWKYEDQINQMVLSCWKDKNVCFCVSTYIGNSVVQVNGKRLSDVKECINKNQDNENDQRGNIMEEEGKEEIGRNVPGMLFEYSKYFKGVDKFNQASSYYLFSHKSVKWYRSIVMWLFEVAINNSFFLYKRFWGQKNLESLDYRLEIIQELKRDFLNESTEEFSQNSTKKVNKCKVGKHKDFPIGDCKHCSKRAEGKRVRSTYICLKCRVYVCKKCINLH